MTTTVLHFMGTLDRAGAESVALDLCRRMPSDEVKQVFCCLSGRAGTMAAEFEEQGAVVDAAGFASPLGAVRVVHAAVRRHRPNAVVSHVSLASGLLLMTAAAMRVPVRIARMHDDGARADQQLVRRAYQSVARAMLVASSTRIVAVSRTSLGFALGRWAPFIRRGRAVVLGNGVDTDRFTPSTERRSKTVPRIVYVGRAHPVKNRGALAPIALALDRRIRCRWWIVGGGGTSDLGTIPEDLFELLGDRSDVADLLRASDVLVLPSTGEGLPGVILEALSTGVPVVASDLDTLRELAAKLPGITLVPVAAPPEEWASAIVAALARTETDGMALRLAIERSEFTLERSVRDWRRLFENG